MKMEQDKLSKFFAKQDKKIQKNGYRTINEIAAKKHSRMQSVKLGYDKNKANEESNKSDEEWGQIDNVEMGSSIGYIPTYTDLSLSKLIDHKRMQQQKLMESQRIKTKNETINCDTNKTTFENTIVEPIIMKKDTLKSKEDIKTESKPTPYRPGNFSRMKSKNNTPLCEILKDETEFPSLGSN